VGGGRGMARIDPPGKVGHCMVDSRREQRQAGGYMPKADTQAKRQSPG
jgi:hypothetical protein